MHYYAGFNIWETEDSTQRLTGSVSDKLELRLVEPASEEAGAMTLSSIISLATAITTLALIAF